MIDFQAYISWDPITRSYDVDELLRDMDENNIRMRVITALNGEGTRKQNDFTRKLVQEHPDRFIGCATINPKEIDCLDEVDRILKMPEFKMIELHSLEHGYRPEKYQHHLDPIFEMCRDAQSIVKVFTGHGFYTMPEQWVFYSHRFPALPFVFEHMGGSDYSYGTIDLITPTNNLYVTTSYETEMQPLMMAFEKLPIEKYLFGSNYPLNFTDLSILKYDILNLNNTQKEHLFEKNAQKLLNLE